MASISSWRSVLAVSAMLVACGGSTGVSAADRHTERLSGGSLAGQTLGPGEWVVHVEAGEPITGTAHVVAVNAENEAEAIVPFGYTWTWGPRRESAVTVEAKLPPGESEHEISIELTAPSAAGTYYLLFGHGCAVNLEQVLSATYWEDGTAVWGDDNDYQDLDADALDDAQRYGYVSDWSFLRSGEYGLEEIAVVPVMIVVSLPTD